MTRRFRPTLQSLEKREVFSANLGVAPVEVEAPDVAASYAALPYSEQENFADAHARLFREQVQPNQQQIIAILIGLKTPS